MGFNEALRPFWHPVLRSEELPKNKPVQAKLLDELIVLYRTRDEVVCFPDLCIHRGSALSLGSIKGENLECPYHGFQFAPDGRCVLIPSLEPDQTIPPKARVVRYGAKEAYGVIWVALEEPHTDVFDFPEYTDSAYRTTLVTDVWQANAARVIENNYDYTHLAFLHAPMLGLRGDDQVRPAEPSPGRRGWEIIAMPADVLEPNYAQSHQPIEPMRVPVRYYSRMIMPLTSHTYKVGMDQNGKETSNVYLFPFAASPMSETETRIFVWVSRNYSLDWPDEEFGFLMSHILEGDKAVVENQRPNLIPTDLREEFFLSNESHHVEYRKWLKELGIE